MEKRYQVFISSTFQDLQNARQEVSQALLRADCFPAGMELFPAADEEQFEFIKTIIDQSDYYILISAGRYGSIHPDTGLSYTEMEYDYAVKIGKPIIRLLHSDPFNELKGEFIEKTAKGRRALETFRRRLSHGALVNHWSDSRELGLLVVSNLIDAIKRYKTTGWVKADQLSNEKARLELSELREKNRMLTASLSKQSVTDFEPILKGLDGNVELHKCEIHPPAEHDIFLDFQSGVFEEYINLEKISFKKTEVVSKPSWWVLKRISFGLLFQRDYNSASRQGLSSELPLGQLNSFFLKPRDQKVIERHVMELETAGLWQPGEDYSSTTLIFRSDSSYLNRNSWKLSPAFRKWLVSLSLPGL